MEGRRLATEANDPTPHAAHVARLSQPSRRQPHAVAQAISASPLKSDMASSPRNVRSVRKAAKPGLMHCSKIVPSFDHLVGAGDYNPAIAVL